VDPNRIAARIVVQFRSAVANLADNLMTSTEQRKKIQRLKNRLLEDPEVGGLDRICMGKHRLGQRHREHEPELRPQLIGPANFRSVAPGTTLTSRDLHRVLVCRGFHLDDIFVLQGKTCNERSPPCCNFVEFSLPSSEPNTARPLVRFAAVKFFKRVQHPTGLAPKGRFITTEAIEREIG